MLRAEPHPEEWQASRGHLAVRSQETTQFLLDKYVIPEIGAFPIAAFSAAGVERVMSALTARGLATATRRRDLSMVLLVFRGRRPSVNVARMVSLPHGGTKRGPHWLRPVQLGRLVMPVPPPCQPVVLFLGTTGCRFSEMGALRVDDVVHTPHGLGATSDTSWFVVNPQLKSAGVSGSGLRQPRGVSPHLPGVWHPLPMAWEWVAPAGTVVVALAGIGATLRTAAQARRHAEHLATANHRQERQEVLRQERLTVYADALAHAVDQERKLNATWASNGGSTYELSPEPPGGPLSLAPMDQISVRMRLLADEEVELAWVALVSAWEGLHWWGELEYSGDPEENTPDEVLQPLRVAIANLKVVCRRSLEL